MTCVAPSACSMGCSSPSTGCLTAACLPAWLVLGGSWWWARRQPAAAAVQAEAGTPVLLARQFLLLWGVVPLVLMLLMAWLGGSKLHLHWGTAFMLWTVPAVMECVGARAPWSALRTVRAAWLVFALVQALVMAQAWMASPKGVRGYKADHTDFFPSERVAASIDRQAQALLDGPVDIISGPQELASVIAVRLPSKPRVIEVFYASSSLPPGAYQAEGNVAWRPWKDLASK